MRRGSRNLPFFYTDRSAKRSHQAVVNSADSQKIEREIPEKILLQRVPACEITTRSRTKKELRSEIEVFATPDRLWQVITHSQRILSNDLTNGRKLSRRISNLPGLRFVMVSRKGKLSHAVLTRSRLNVELGWKQRRFLIPGLLETETVFEIVPNVEGVGTTLVRSEIFSGLAVPLMKNQIRTARTDIQLSNIQIREKAEAIS